ncbi:hypothetical protein [Aquabacterium sp.]|uniref:hypothetical protein n=1 Tax=Aquabacterium sp. TaxID=1872578 RepID=UPI002486CE65|nr:hypothetical protein [Aquabacterium sp.]MDI1258318.1 hypothetical protein [Aquabacterium sp.]
MPATTEQPATHAAEGTWQSHHGGGNMWPVAQFAKSKEGMPSELTAAMAMVKRACVKASRDLAQVSPGMAEAIDLATSNVISDPYTALQVAASVGVAHNLLPALVCLNTELELTAASKHPKTSQELVHHVDQLMLAHQSILAALPREHQLVMHQGTSRPVREQVAKALTLTLRLPFTGTLNTLPIERDTDQLVSLHGTLTSAAMALNNIAQAMRNLASAQQDAMQCDALAMVCRQVTDNDACLATRAHDDEIDSHSFKPLLAHKLLQSIRLLTDATTVFTEYFVRGITVSSDPISHGLASSLMLVTSNNTIQAV